MVLDEIIADKRREIASLTGNFSDLVKDLPGPRDFLQAFKKGKFSLIAEIKRASPSAGVIRPNLDPITLAKIYEESGASAVSVLTDQKYFQGKLEDLKAAKDSTTIPILRKDFIISEAQVYESRIAGADAILLIARILKDDELNKLLALTEELGMQALVEVHNEDEAKRALKTKAKVIGINNRDLDTLAVDLQLTVDLMRKLPELKKRIIISESGIADREDIERLKMAGVDGVLMGETLLRSGNIAKIVLELFSHANTRH